jgi:hypothetical protein
MAKYIDCFVGKDGLLYIGGLREKGVIGYIKHYFRYFKPRIIFTKKEAEKLGATKEQIKKGFYVKSQDGIRVPVDVFN